MGCVGLKWCFWDEIGAKNQLFRILSHLIRDKIQFFLAVLLPVFYDFVSAKKCFSKTFRRAAWSAIRARSCVSRMALGDSGK